ncbi:MAG: IS630 family transposase, partial [Hyphomonas sp.]|nr:IS630 family transposase [Hyphomonas sp.]MCR9195099.1 IS630 family transposase [Hyphomonas sp.]MCR9195395.1 IS630 family transposase [Hyphomonas sp.]MCR9196443.1 IS630 family transposase [Hyphomonas sp.]
MRMAQKRTVQDTWQHVGRLVPTISADECQNYFLNAGYASVKT